MAAGLGLAAGPALAHGSAQGLGAFWNGVLHAWMEPSQLLALLALGLWLAIHRLSREAELRSVVAGSVAFALAALAARFSGLDAQIADAGLPDRAMQVAGVLMALATVADRAPQTRWLLPLATAITLAGAALGSPAASLRGIDAFGWMAGVALGITLIVAYTAIGARWIRARVKIGAVVPRVLASWLCASLLLVVAMPWVTARRCAAADNGPSTQPEETRCSAPSSSTRTPTRPPPPR